MEIIKRDGRRVSFNREKISEAIMKAYEDVNKDKDVSNEITNFQYQAIEISKAIENHAKDNTATLSVEEIQDMVENHLMNMGFYPVAKAYILYRSERDKKRHSSWDMTDLQRDIYEQKYQWKNESFEEFLDRVSGGNVVIKELIRSKKFIPAGRILAGRGTNGNGRKVCYSNCFTVDAPQDSIPSIFDTAKDCAQIYKAGGGVGLTLNYLRPRGSKVNNTAKSSTGAASFAELYDTTTSLISQGSRAGALMLTLPIDHPDSEEFINMKTNDNKITKANISVGISDEFMKAVERKDKSYTQKFVVKDTGEVIEKKVDPLALFRLISSNANNYAEPGILFWDNINNYHISDHVPDFEYESVNPCLAGNTKILTDEGYIEIKELIGKKVNIWNGYQWSEVEPKITGYNQPMLRLTFSNGEQLDVTDYHKFILMNGTRLEARNLQIGDKLTKWEFPRIEGHKEIQKKKAYTMGFYSGDGTYNQELNGLYDKEFVPDCSYNIQTRLNWLAGIIDADGCRSAKAGGISISSINKNFLIKIKNMLETLGIHSTVSDMKPDDCQASYRILVSPHNTDKLMGMGLETVRVNLDSEPDRDASRFIYIKDIERIENAEKVYCLNEPNNHSLIANGVLTANCGEKPLISSASCLLSSVNLSQYVINPFEDNAEFDYTSFKEDMREIVIFMDDLLEEGLEYLPLDRNKEMTRDYRSLGIGVMGLADALIKLGLTYGKREAISEIEKIFKVMINIGLQQSSLLAKERGTYPKYDKKYVLKSTFINSVADNKTIELIEKYGLRNVEVLSVAP